MVEVQYVAHLIKNALLGPNYERFCQTSSEDSEVYKSLRTLINSVDNLRWCHRDVDLSKGVMWKNLMNVRTKGAALANYANWNAVKGDAKRLAGMSAYTAFTFDTHFFVTRENHHIYTIRAPLSVSELNILSKDEFMKKVYIDMFEVATQVQAQARFIDPNQTGWDIRTLDDVNFDLENFVEGKVGL